MIKGGFTDFHCHTNIDWVCDVDLTPAFYAQALDGELRRVVITDHGLMYYFYEREVLFKAEWMINPEIFDAQRESGDAKLAENIRKIRSLKNPNVFAGIETDMMRDGRLTHPPSFADDFDVIIGSIHFLPWITTDMSKDEILRLWIDYVERLIFTSEIDVWGHPLRWLAAVQRITDVPDSLMKRLVELIEESGITVEINPPKGGGNGYGTLLSLLVKMIIERGLPIVFGTDSHRKQNVGNFAPHLYFLDKLGISVGDVNMPEVEDFINRKGRRDKVDSRPGTRG